ncbi:hypothetical protein BC936DRAFT_141366 [Jimgerdemannia flammicorona]|uniref:Uncharacterized protein n=2 Tax=Jimgerdemannia flammicorona TaxID=994334 RepID=A0A433Q333_9FUNG|nr:hypothetical protein BC936DRAFT_141366 [Jimgerdemannia flammicorona]RUS24215.1 hypothetical protein BC938DRAFT_473934 [Jimgerdemannia flammicorona]
MVDVVAVELAPRPGRRHLRAEADYHGKIILIKALCRGHEMTEDFLRVGGDVLLEEGAKIIDRITRPIGSGTVRGRCMSTLEALLAVFVVDGSFIRVAEHLICLPKLFEVLVGEILVVGVTVGVPLQGLSLVSLLYIVYVCVPQHVQGCVVVFAHFCCRSEEKLKASVPSLAIIVVHDVIDPFPVTCN